MILPCGTADCDPNYCALQVAYIRLGVYCETDV